MKIIVDTCIWSLALRRDKKGSDHLIDELIELINEVRVQLIGPIRQEILSGIKTKKQFITLKKNLSAFPDLQLQSKDFELAAEFFNTARSKGIQGSNTDFMICSMAHRYNMSIFTTDKDFSLFAQVIPIKLYEPRLKPNHENQD
ncbi:MAG: PIN domain-containing protein [Proteobacteria bacterium]|nr:PIN domain-containing protein [Pseudomonadota bacterium]MBU1581246.1 PIN domain-containing protein [Pseudomonadota bacterium]MBU2456028.1 PIN domain-containing protein [Pseudomonadota bacterium]